MLLEGTVDWVLRLRVVRILRSCGGGIGPGQSYSCEGWRRERNGDCGICAIGRYGVYRGRDSAEMAGDKSGAILWRAGSFKRDYGRDRGALLAWCVRLTAGRRESVWGI